MWRGATADDDRGGRAGAQSLLVEGGGVEAVDPDDVEDSDDLEVDDDSVELDDEPSLELELELRLDVDELRLSVL